MLLWYYRVAQSASSIGISTLRSLKGEYFQHYIPTYQDYVYERDSMLEDLEAEMDDEEEFQSYLDTKYITREQYNYDPEVIEKLMSLSEKSLQYLANLADALHRNDIPGDVWR